MANFTELASASWRAQVRREGHYVSETFLGREEARCYATETEVRVRPERAAARLPLKNLVLSAILSETP